MKVSEAMSREVDYVYKDDTIRTASQIIFGRKVNGLPVCNDSRKVVGFITERDILQKFLPTLEDLITDPVRSQDFEKMESNIDEILDMKVAKVMIKKATTVKENTQLLRAQSLMFSNKIGRLPVVDEEGKLIGMITKGDIFRCLVGDRLPTEDNEEFNDWLSRHYPFLINWEKRMAVEIPEIVKVLKKNKVKTVVDIGCGTGHHSIELAKQGFRVYGFERSRFMIEDANKARNKLPRNIQDNITFLAGEYKDNLSTITEDVGAALFMGAALAYNPTGHKDILKITAQKLSPHSVMIIQLPNMERIVKEKNRFNGLSFHSDEKSSEHAVMEFYGKPASRGRSIEKNIAVFYKRDNSKWRFYGMQETLMTYLTKDEIDEELRRLGFGSIQYFGSKHEPQNWDRIFKKPFEGLHSDWMNIIAIRK